MSNYITKPKPGVMINPLHPLSRGLIGYWLFNEGAGSLVNDISGRKNHGLVRGVVPNVQGTGWHGSEWGGALVGNGVDVYANIPDGLTTPSTPVTLEAWVKPNVDGTNVAESQPIITSDFVRIHIRGDNNTINLRYDSAGGAITTIHELGTGFRELVQIVGVFNGDKTITLYVNGEYKSTNTGAQVALTDFSTYVGRYVNGYFNGCLEKVTIYNRVLSASEVKILYEQPFCNLMK